MPAAMHLTVLVSLFAATLCENTTTSSTAKLKEITTSAAHHTSLAATKTSLFNVTTNNTQQPPTTTHQITTAVTSENISSLPLPLTSPQTPNRTEETHPSVTPQTTTTNQTFNETGFHGSTLPPAPESPNITAITTVNITSPDLSHEWGDLAANPGLVAILCIFCIILVLVLVVVSLKCIRSPTSNFERLEDVPMSKVNEESPFAQYTK